MPIEIRELTIKATVADQPTDKAIRDKKKHSKLLNDVDGTSGKSTLPSDKEMENNRIKLDTGETEL